MMLGFRINYGPDGEENWANLIAPDGSHVANIRTHHAKSICDGMNASRLRAGGGVRGCATDECGSRPSPPPRASAMTRSMHWMAEWMGWR